MKTIEITLVKRNNKLILHLLASFFCVLGILGFAASMSKDGFSWWTAIIGALFVFGALLIGSRLYLFFTSNEVKLVAETDSKTMTFYNKTESGKRFNKSEPIRLSKMGRFYIVKQRTRYLMNNYAFAFETKGSRTSLFKEEVDAFPSLFEATSTDRNRILEFVKSTVPEIELGYENMWQKQNKSN